MLAAGKEKAGKRYKKRENTTGAETEGRERHREMTPGASVHRRLLGRCQATSRSSDGPLTLRGNERRGEADEKTKAQLTE